jgi:tRNA(adenine34) deaminase
MASAEYYEKNMGMALEQARLAGLSGEVPVGAVVVRSGEIISTGYNKREGSQNALMHAEIEAISGACRALHTWRLSDCALFVTLEPCPMCAGAIINSRIKTVVIGAKDAKAGACGSVINLFACPFNHRPEVVSGILEGECASLLKDFFGKLRK